MKKLLSVLVLFGAFVAVALFFLPFLLSSDFFLAKMLAQINQRPGQHLEIGDLNIGWTEGLRCEEVRYEDAAHSLNVRLDRLQGDRGLFALLMAPKNLGTFTLFHPVVTVAANHEQTKEDGATQKGDTPNGHEQGKAEQKQQPGQDNPDGGPAALWQDMTIQVVIRDGEVIVLDEKSKPAFPPGKIQLNTSLAHGTVEYDLNWQSGDQGRLDAQGRVNLPADQAHFFDTLVLKTNLQVKRFQLAPLFALAARTGNTPTGEGVLDGELSITGAGRSKLDLVGQLECTDLSLQGGFLRQDHPRIARLALSVDGGKKEDNSYSLNDLRLDGDFGHVQATGEYGKGRGDVRAEGTLLLPFFTRQLPSLLHVDKNAILSTGEFSFTGDLALSGETKNIQVQAFIDHMAGRLRGKPFSWGRAAQLTLAAGSTGQDLSVDTLLLKTAFATLSGKGTMEHFTLQGNIDLRKADTQLGTLFAIPWHGQGNIASHVEVNRVHDGGKQVNFTLQSKQFGLVHKKRTVLPRAPLHVQGELTLPEGQAGRTAPVALRVDTRAWPGNVSVTGNELCLQPAPGKGRFTLQGDVDLARISKVLHGIGSMPANTGYSGRLRINTDGVLDGNQLTLTNPQLRGQDLVITMGNRVVREPRLTLQGREKPKKAQSTIAVRGLQVASSRASWTPRAGGSIHIDLKKKAVQIRDLSLSSETADLDISTVVLDDPGALPGGWQGLLTGRLNLERVGTIFQPPHRDGQTVRPSGELTFTLDGQQLKAPYALALQCSAKDVRLKRSGTVLYTDPAVSLNIKTQGRLDGDALQIAELIMGSAPLAIRATGTLQQGKQRRLDLQGKHTIHFAQLARIINGLSGKDLLLKGDTSKTFTLSMPLDGTWKKHGVLKTSLAVDALSLAGIEAGPVTLPIAFAGGKVQTALRGELNKGRLDLKALLDFLAKPPAITMPAHQRVLTDVHIDKPVADGILSRLHPLFGILAKPTGKFSAVTESFFWPLPEKDRNQARFKVIFDTSRIDLVSQGIMREILQLLSVKDEHLSLRQSQVTCTCDQGRIGCSPVKVLVADSEMTISGSVGLDKTLDYLLEIPVTEKLIGREGARVLEGTVIAVPIRGTLGEPLFDRSIITDMLANLAGQAAKKAIKKQVDKIIPDLFKKLKF